MRLLRSTTTSIRGCADRSATRLLEHLDETSRDLQQVLTLEKELARVQQESSRSPGSSAY
ncbi:MAG: hypothetical protein U0992_21990 [Planctomycetaceae bacterium]